MSRGKTRLISLSKRWFDLSWFLMVAMGAASLRLSGHPIGQAPWLSNVLLSIALCIGFMLAVFVKRQEQALNRPGDVVDLNAEVVHSEIQLIEKEELNIENIEVDEEWHPISLHRSIIERRTHHRNLLWESMYLANASPTDRMREEIISTTKQVVEKYLASSHHAAAHRDLVREVVDIAKQLRGTGMEVKISPDQEIRICEAQRLPFPDDELNLDERYHLSTQVN
ncbi:MAG TPA: hypothetical protein VME86_09800 [Acidobacteriaceae bacterium]|nr:hypothetical protein [Acidobacteriaceae bacterium]